MRNITLTLKNPKDDSKIDIVSYTNVEDGCVNNGFFSVYVKEKNKTSCETMHDVHYYPSHLILKIESEYTKQYSFGLGPMTIEKKTISINDL